MAKISGIIGEHRAAPLVVGIAAATSHEAVDLKASRGELWQADGHDVGAQHRIRPGLIIASGIL